MPKKKIIYIITKSVWGGASKYVHDLAVNMPKDKFEVFVAAGGEGPLAQKLIGAGISYYNIKNFQRDINLLKDIFAYFEIILLFLKIRPEIIHVNSSKAGGLVGMAFFSYRLITFNFGNQAVFTAHGWAFHESRPEWQIFLIKLFSKATVFFYSKVICVSDYDRASAIKNRIAPENKLITVRNGINADEYDFLENGAAKNHLCEICRVSQEDFLQNIIIGNIGEFTKNKGQEYLIKAAERLKIKKLKFKILIIGWGEKKSELESQIFNLGLGNDVFLVDGLTPATLHLKAFDLFILPSLKEGLPYTILEAGLANLPVIATRTGGIPEIIDENLVMPGNSDELAQKIEEVLNNKAGREKIAENLKNRIINDFSLEKMLNATLAAYE